MLLLFQLTGRNKNQIPATKDSLEKKLTPFPGFRLKRPKKNPCENWKNVLQNHVTKINEFILHFCCTDFTHYHKTLAIELKRIESDGVKSSKLAYFIIYFFNYFDIGLIFCCLHKKIRSLFTLLKICRSPVRSV